MKTSTADIINQETDKTNKNSKKWRESTKCLFMYSWSAALVY